MMTRNEMVKMACCLTPNDCCKLNSARFAALMGANRKLRMVTVHITCTLPLLPPFYGPNSTLKTDIPRWGCTLAAVYSWGEVSPQEIEYLRDGPCFVYFGPSVLHIILCGKFKEWAHVSRPAGSGRRAIMAEIPGKMGETFYCLIHSTVLIFHMCACVCVHVCVSVIVVCASCDCAFCNLPNISWQFNSTSGAIKNTAFRRPSLQAHKLQI